MCPRISIRESVHLSICPSLRLFKNCKYQSPITQQPLPNIFRHILASLHGGLSVRLYVHLSIVLELLFRVMIISFFATGSSPCPTHLHISIFVAIKLLKRFSGFMFLPIKITKSLCPLFCFLSVTILM